MRSDVRIVTALGTVCAFLVVAAFAAAIAHDSGIPAQSSLRLPPATTSSSETTVAPTAATTVLTTTTTVPTTTSTTPKVVAVDANHRWAVGTYLLNLVDTSRPTAPAGSDPGAANRTLPTVVLYPADGAPTAPETPGGTASHLGGPYPLIVFGHGFNSSPARYAGLLHAWAAAGYVVAAPSFPRALEGSQLDEGDLNNQPGDMRFVITKMLAASASPGPLSGLIDPGRIGAAGHSDGADAALGLGYNSCCRDTRVKAVLVGEADEHVFPGGTYFPAGSAPLLLTQADQDVLNPPPYGQQIFADARTPKYLLWLINAQHLEPFTTDQAHLNVVEQASIDFFDRYLKGRADGLTRLRSDAPRGLATLTAG